jgi:hypothetical protein
VYVNIDYLNLWICSVWVTAAMPIDLGITGSNDGELKSRKALKNGVIIKGVKY